METIAIGTPYKKIMSHSMDMLQSYFEELKHARSEHSKIKADMKAYTEAISEMKKLQTEAESMLVPVSHKRMSDVLNKMQRIAMDPGKGNSPCSNTLLCCNLLGHFKLSSEQNETDKVQYPILHYANEINHL